MTAVNNKMQCITCGKDKVTYECRGCLKNFCLNHLNEHNQELSKQLDEIEDQHNQFRQTLTEKKIDPEKHALFKQIDQWETESILQIKQTANETRNSLLECIHEHITVIETKFKELTTNIKQIRTENDFNEININELQRKLGELENQFVQPKNICMKKESKLIDKISIIVISSNKLSNNSKWLQNGITVAGGNGQGSQLNQLFYPWKICVDDDENVYIADCNNHRIVKWKRNANIGESIAGGNGCGKEVNQLNSPANVIFDRTSDSMIIADRQNRRVVRWPRLNGKQGEIIITDIDCWGLAMDNNGYLYVTDIVKHEIKRWKIGDKNGVLVAGGNGSGDRLDQLNKPVNMCIGHDGSLYISEYENHRVVKWTKDAKQGIIVAGGQGLGSSLKQLHSPCGLTVDQFDTLYVTDYYNHRITRWLKGATEGSIILGGNGQGRQDNQFAYPADLYFDQQNNIYVSDLANARVQKFSFLI